MTNKMREAALEHAKQFNDEAGHVISYEAGWEAALEDVQKVVDEQAEDEALWAVPAIGLQSIGEAYLQQELRRLHKAIEDITNQEGA